jgi:hypothetical protein
MRGPELECSRVGGAWDYRKDEHEQWGAYCDLNGHAVLYSNRAQFEDDLDAAAQAPAAIGAPGGP